MRKRHLILASGAVMFTAFAIMEIRTSPVLHRAPTRGLASLATLRDAPARALTEIREEEPAFRFRRELTVHAGSEKAIDLSLQGSFWLKTEGATQVLTLQIEKSPILPTNPWVRVEFAIPRQILKIWTPGEGSARSDESEQLARAAVDILDQLMFFETTDSAGQYRAEISKVSDGRFQKRKLQYVSGSYAHSEVVKSSHRLWVQPGDAHPAPARTLMNRGEEEILLQESGLKFSSRYLIVRTKSLPIPSGAQWPQSWRPVALGSLDPATAMAAKGADRYIDLSRVPEASEIAASLRRETLPKKLVSLYRPLIKRIDAEPSTTLPLISADLAELKREPKRLQIVIGALAASYQPEAQRMLTSMFQDPSVTPETRGVILNALVNTHAELTADTRDLLKSVAADPTRPADEQRGALLALGAEMSRSEDGQTRADLQAVMSAKIEEAKAAQAERAQLQPTLDSLDAIGNSKDPQYIDWIQTQLASKSDTVRSHAYLALRMIPGALAQGLLRAGSADSSGRVRHAVAMALEMRKEFGVESGQ